MLTGTNIRSFAQSTDIFVQLKRQIKTTKNNVNKSLKRVDYVRVVVGRRKVHAVKWLVRLLYIIHPAALIEMLETRSLSLFLSLYFSNRWVYISSHATRCATAFVQDITLHTIRSMAIMGVQLLF